MAQVMSGTGKDFEKKSRREKPENSAKAAKNTTMATNAAIGCQACCQQSRNEVSLVHRLRKLDVFVRPRHLMGSLFKITPQISREFASRLHLPCYVSVA